MSSLPMGCPALSVLATFLLLALQESGTAGYQMAGHLENRSVFRRDHSSRPHDSLTKMAPDVFGLVDESVSDVDESQQSSDETSLLDAPKMSKRRNGPTLSVVNPLEILRQRLMLDMARRRMLENQQQIEANAALLEDIGKRSVGQDRFQP